MSAPAETHGIKPFLPVLLAVLLWGTGYWPISVANEHAPPSLVAGLRTLPAGIFLLLTLPLLGSKLPRGRMLLWAIGTGLLMIGFFQWALTEAVDRTGPGTGAVLVNSPPLFVLVLGWIFLAERVTAARVGGLAVGFTGVVLMVSGQLGTTTETTRLILGVLIGLSAALAWAIGTILLRRIAKTEESPDLGGFAAVQYTVSGLILFPIGALVAGADGADWGSAGLWAPAIWIGPVAALGVFLFYKSLQRVSATRVSAFLFLVPTVAVIVELLRGNSPGAVALTGMFLAIVGVALVSAPADRLTRGALLPSPLRSR